MTAASDRLDDLERVRPRDGIAEPLGEGGGHGLSSDYPQRRHRGAQERLNNRDSVRGRAYAH